MNRIIAKVWAPLAFITDIALLTSLITDLVLQYKDRRKAKNHSTDSHEPEPTPATEEA